MLKRGIAGVVMALVVIGVVVAPALAAAPLPPYTDVQCKECHNGGAPGGKGDFTVAPVPKETACAKCHWRDATHPHNQGTSCGGCHKSNWVVSPLAVPKVPTAFGWFNSASSPSAPPERLHDIHLNPGWTATADYSTSRCASCHARAACTACHEEEPTHGDHTYDADTASRTATAWVGVTASGTWNLRELTAVNSAVPCAASTCHDPASIAMTKVENDSPGTRLTGTWATVRSLRYSGGSEALTKVLGSSVSFPVSGARVTVYGTKGYYYGTVTVRLDGEVVDTFSGYALSAGYQNALFTMTLPPGSHEMSLTLSAKGPAGQNFGFDSAISEPASERFIPTCTGCHGAGEDHVSVHDGAGVDSLCGTCHIDQLVNEHMVNPKTQKTQLDCDTCHASNAAGVQWAISMSDRRCGACHTSGHNMVFSAETTAVAKYPGLTWSSAIPAGVWAGEPWMIEGLEDGSLVLSSRSPALTGPQVWDFYRDALTLDGWHIAEMPTNPGSGEFRARFAKDGHDTVVWFYGGYAPGSGGALDAGSRIVILFK